MIVKIDKKLKELGKSRYWLSKESGFSYPNLTNLCKNKTDSIKFWVLDSICNILECGIEDILEIEKPTNN